MSSIVHAFIPILGREVAVRRALSAGEFVISATGEVIGFPGYAGYALGLLCAAYIGLSGHAAIEVIKNIVLQSGIEIARLELPPEISSELPLSAPVGV